MDMPQTMKVTQVLLFLMNYLPGVYNWLFDKIVNTMSKKSFPKLPAEWNFYPAPPAYITNPLMGDEIYKLMESGWAKPVPAVRKFTGPNSVLLTDGTTLDDIDAVVYCTGYDGSVPFLKGDLNPYPTLGEQGNFYRNLFLLHPDKDIRESLAFIGHGGIVWPGLSLFELQSVAVAQIWKGKSKLPPLEEMKKWKNDLIASRRKMLASSPIKSTHYPAMLPTSSQLAWIDATTGADLFSHFGWSWKAWKFWWQDREFYNLCNNGIFSPAMWRLFDTGKRKAWPEAREQIYEDNRVAEAGVARRKAYVEALEAKKNV
jgi:dimethylaniline monooxygenase (N-oxide forming)